MIISGRHLATRNLLHHWVEIPKTQNAAEVLGYHWLMRFFQNSGKALAATAAVGMLVFGTAACGSTSTTTATQAAPKLAHLVATARGLVTSWLTALKGGNTKTISGFLAPNFIIQRADGSTSNKAEYLKNPPTVNAFTVGKDILAIQNGNSLSVRWSLEIDEVINGKTFTKGEAARLTGFTWSGSRWQIATYANFNLPK